VSELKEFRESFARRMKSRNACNNHSVDIICYKGALEKPRWQDLEPCIAVHCWSRLTLISSNPASFSKLCTINADLSELSRTLRPQKSAFGQSEYYSIDFDVIILFGQTERKAQVSWKHKVVLFPHRSTSLLTVYVAQGVEMR
jgi:hypothetical protein